MNDYRLFIDKYRPKSFQEIFFNHKASNQLIACAQYGPMPHLIIKGPEGSGRKTFASLYIKAKYGDLVHIKQQVVEITNSTKTIELQMLYSDYHYQIDPSSYGVYDRLIIQGFIKDIIQARPISQIPYHLIIINNADKLTIEAQQSLRRTLEKNVGTCRFIFLVDQESNLIDSLNSRCVQIRLSAPTITEIIQVLDYVCHQEKITCDQKHLHRIAINANRNMTQALNYLQLYLLTRSQLQIQSQLSIEQISPVETCLDGLVTQLLHARSPDDIQQLRPILNDLLVQCVEPLKIMKGLFQRILKTLNSLQQHQLIEILDKYERTLKQGSKPIYHLEGFCLSVVVEILQHKTE